MKTIAIAWAPNHFGEARIADENKYGAHRRVSVAYRKGFSDHIEALEPQSDSTTGHWSSVAAGGVLWGVPSARRWTDKMRRWRTTKKNKQRRNENAIGYRIIRELYADLLSRPGWIPAHGGYWRNISREEYERFQSECSVVASRRPLDETIVDGINEQVQIARSIFGA